MAYYLMPDRFLCLLKIACFLFTTIKCSDGMEAPVYRENDFISYIPDSPHIVMFFAPW